MDDVVKDTVRSVLDGVEADGTYRDDELVTFVFKTPRRVANLFLAHCEDKGLDNQKVLENLLEVFVEKIRGEIMLKSCIDL